MEFLAKNPPSILILAGVLGWILNGAIYVKTSAFGQKSLLPAQKQCVS